MAREITRVNHQDVHPGDSEAWAGETFSIPSVPPSDLIGCGIIDVDYFIEVDNFNSFVVKIFSINDFYFLLLYLITAALLKLLDSPMYLLLI